MMSRRFWFVLLLIFAAPFSPVAQTAKAGPPGESPRKDAYSGHSPVHAVFGAHSACVQARTLLS
jgi:hypothetical protein